MQQKLKWRYYNHAAIPTTSPHEKVDESPLQSGRLWKSVGGRPLLARWTTDFDCREQTDWWYIIKDKPFDIMDVKKNYRPKIRRGLKYFDVRVIDPAQYAEALYQVHREALASYPPKCRPTIDHDQFVASLEGRSRKGVTFAAFSKEDNSLAGYSYDILCDGYVMASVQKAKPSEKKKQVNAALILAELDYFKQELARGVYIMAGERNVIHPTKHQEYLEKTFGFRKAYCQMHIEYRRGIRQIVDCLYPLRGLIKHLERIKLFCRISSVLKMEEIARRRKNPRPIEAFQGNGELVYQPTCNSGKALPPLATGNTGHRSDVLRASGTTQAPSYASWSFHARSDFQAQRHSMGRQAGI